MNVYFATILSKNLQKSSAIKNNSITLSPVIIAIIVLYFFVPAPYILKSSNKASYLFLLFCNISINIIQ